MMSPALRRRAAAAPLQTLPRPTRRDFADAQANLIALRCEAVQKDPAALGWIDAALFAVAAGLVADAEEQRASQVPVPPRRPSSAPCSPPPPTVAMPLQFEETTAWPLPAFGFAATELAPGPVAKPLSLLPLP